MLQYQIRVPNSHLTVNCASVYRFTEPLQSWQQQILGQMARAAAAVNSHGYVHQASTTTEPATATSTAHGNSGRRPRTAIAFPAPARVRGVCSAFTCRYR